MVGETRMEIQWRGPLSHRLSDPTTATGLHPYLRPGIADPVNHKHRQLPVCNNIMAFLQHARAITANCLITGITTRDTDPAARMPPARNHVAFEMDSRRRPREAT